MESLIRQLLSRRWLCVFLFTGVLVVPVYHAVYASDHLDTPTVIADPAADIGDIFAWTSSDGRRLNLVMDIVAHQFSDRLQYVLPRISISSFNDNSSQSCIDIVRIGRAAISGPIIETRSCSSSQFIYLARSAFFADLCNQCRGQLTALRCCISQGSSETNQML